LIRRSARFVLYRRTEDGETEPYRVPYVRKAEGPTDKALEAVAALYTMAVVIGDPPTRTVATVLNLPRSTAGYWVSKARDKGLLTVRAPRRPRDEED
jgi:hypothetical protein